MEVAVNSAPKRHYTKTAQLRARAQGRSAEPMRRRRAWVRDAISHVGALRMVVATGGGWGGGDFAIDKHSAGKRVVEAFEELDDRRLSTARLTNERHLLPFLDHQRNTWPTSLFRDSLSDLPSCEGLADRAGQELRVLSGSGTPRRETRLIESQ
jgi:sugar phosphate isomerase/epimerase